MVYGKIPASRRRVWLGIQGEILIGKLGGTPIVVLSGRAHFYEGHPMEAVTFAMRALAAYGIRDVVLTNAAGASTPASGRAIHGAYGPHQFDGRESPWRADSGLPRFVDLTRAYDEKLGRMLHRAGVRAG